jgi:predicted XRE-type DNA-binding protein
MAGRVLVRFWHAAQDANSEEQSMTLRAEIDYIMYVELLVETGPPSS